MKHPVYVIGHKNPDTDTIVSSIAYAEYKRQTGVDALAGRLGSVSSETEYLLDKFSFEDPMRIYTGKSTLSEIDKDKAALASKDMTMKDALDKVMKLKNRGLVVVDTNKKLEGIVTLDDLTYMWTKTDKQLEKIIKTIKLENVLKTLNASIVVEGKRPLSGHMHMFPSIRSNVEIDSIALLRNEDDKLEYCLDLGASLIIVVTSSPISKKIIKMAQDMDATIVVTKLSPLSVTRLIYQTPAIEEIMISKEKINYFNINDTVEEASKKIAKSRHRSYPVLDDDNTVVGSISRYHLFNYEKKKFILVDHNEIKQSVDDIESAEILEIVDHHRLGGFESDNPINITTSTVGACSTIIANMYLENKSVKLSKKMAGLLLGAIVSDTMNFKSPTTTPTDISVAKRLERISGVSADDLSKEMVEHAESLLSKRFIEIVYNDFKEFNIEGNKVGLAQASCKRKSEYLILKDDLKKYLEDSCISNHYDLMIAMLTNPNGSGSYLIYAGNKSSAIKEMFPNKIKDGFVRGLVSRKKQLLPEVISTLGGK